MIARAQANLQQADDRLLIAGRYAVEGALGKGGAAQVYQVRDLANGTQLALKQLSPQASSRLAALFELEYQTLAGMQHPCVVRVFDFGRDRGAPFYTMELLEGEDLKERAPISYRVVCRHVRDVARALALLHARRLVHRDVSPRNLWRTPDGRVKLIDFGSLAAFGRSDHVVGTPPFVAPEALHGQDLDQCTDLYALGAVAYFLLTRMHAFGARELGELPALWQQPPLPPSACVAELGRTDLEAVPPELDALVLALLNPSVLARPSSSAEVIDRIDALVGKPDDAVVMQREVMRAHLVSTAYVGQRRVRRTLERQLSLARGGRGQSCVIAGDAGSGRSRTLRELSLLAQVGETAVLHVRATASERPYEAASALALQLLRALPREAGAAAHPLAATLSPLSPEVAAALGESAVVSAATSSELRPRLSRVLCEWFLTTARDRPLLVLVDDLERADEDTLTFLLALAEARRHSRLFLACSVTSDPREITAAERALRASSRTLTLEPLDEVDTLALLHSVFGDVENVGRLASRLWHVSRGNPGHTLELCEELLAREVIGYADGAWLLPQELPAQLLSASREQALLARLSRLDERSRALARALSVHPDATPLELSTALADSVAHGDLSALHALLEAGVCVIEGQSVHFAHEPLRRALYEELTPAARARAHSVVGAFLLERASSALDQLRAGVHLLESGDPRGSEIVTRTCLHITLHEADTIKPAARATERALTLLRAANRPGREQVTLLALLSIAGYSADRRYAADYGATAVAVMRDVVGLTLARKLRPYLGRKLALFIALGVAGAKLGRYRKDPRVVPLKEAISLLFSAVGALAGTSTVCVDPDGARAYAEVLEPFTALGPKHVASFMYEYSVAISETARDQSAKTRLRWKALFERLDGDEPLDGVTASVRQRLLHGACSSLGTIEAQRDGDEALRLAQRSAGSGLLLAELAAEHIRALYHANQGNLSLFEHHRARAEQQAIQLGTSWQVETWVPSAKSYVAFRAHDAMTLKQASDQLHRLSLQTPSLQRAARRTQGAYLAVRGRRAEAIPLLEEVLQGEPRDYAGWTRTHGILATTLNQMGQYQRALDVCLHVFAHSTEADLSFGGAILGVQRERLVAEANLGDADGAYARLLALIGLHETAGGALTVGELHDAGLTVALLRGDLEAAGRHFDEMERRYLSTGVPSLAQHCARRRRRLLAHTLRSSGNASGAASLTSTTMVSSVSTQDPIPTIERMLAGGALSDGERAHKALEIIAEHTRMRHGHLYLLDERGELREVASLAEEVLPPDVAAWLKGVVRSELSDDDETKITPLGAESEGNLRVWVTGSRAYRMLPLSVGRLIGCAILVSDEGVPPYCTIEVLNAIAYQLNRAARPAQTIVHHAPLKHS